MAIRFDIPLAPEQRMAGIIDGLARAQDPAQPATPTSYFTHALHSLIDLESSRNAGMIASPDITTRFRENISTALVEQSANFEAFYYDTYNAALNAANGELYKACMAPLYGTLVPVP